MDSWYPFMHLGRKRQYLVCRVNRQQGTMQRPAFIHRLYTSTNKLWLTNYSNKLLFQILFRLAQSTACTGDLARWLSPCCKATERRQYTWSWKGISLAIFFLSSWKEAVSPRWSWWSKLLSQAGSANTEGSERGTKSASLEVLPPQNHAVVWVWGEPPSKPVELWSFERAIHGPSAKAWELFAAGKLSSLFH